jgi:predicted porin
LNFSVDYLDPDNATNDANVNVSSNSSNIIFKGSEDLGGGLKAVWQIQSYFSAGGTGNSDTGVAGESVKDGVGSGNTFIGLAGDFGTAIMGKHEAPMKLVGRKIDLFGDQIGDNRNFTNKPGSLSSGFDLRPDNVIAYISPTFSGFHGALAYVTNVGSTANSANAVDAYSALGMYENGPLMVAVGYQVNNTSETGVAEDESAIRLSASYAFGDFKVVGLYQQASDLGGTSGMDVDTWGAGVAYKMGAITLKGQYYSADDRGNVADSASSMYVVGADYSLSKRTTVQLAYASTDNDKNANYSAFAGGHGDQPTIANGSSPSGISLGVKHSF